MSLPMTALDIQLDLLRFYTRTDGGKRYSDAVIDCTFNEKEDPRISRALTGMGVLLHEHILFGETYAVTSDIVDVLEQAAPSMPQFVMSLSDLPSKSGFVYLERPVVVPDRHGAMLVVRGFGWHTATMHDAGEEQMAIDLLGRPFDERLNIKLLNERGELPNMAMAVLLWTEPGDERDHMYPQYTAHPEFRAPHDMMSCIGGLWQFDKSWDWEQRGMDIAKLVLAFMRFIEEPWISNKQVIPDRPTMKRAVRARRREPEIHVVQLRRTGSTTHQGSSDSGVVEWSHRWLVRGHWRNQWYPSQQDHRPRWIPEHIKGPDDKPLIVHDKIFSVER